MADRVTVGNLVFYVEGETLSNSAKIAVMRFSRAIGIEPKTGQSYSVTVERDSRAWRFVVRPLIKLEVECLDVSEFREQERSGSQAY